MTPVRLRLASLVLVALLAGMAFLAWSQTWFRIAVPPHPLAVGGDVAGSAIPALGLASLALVLALALAGPGFRVVLGLLESLLGVAVCAVAGFALANPLAAAASAITKATGLAGVTGAPGEAAATGWPVLAIVAGALMVACGLFIAVTGRAWPATGRRFRRTRAVAVDPRDADETEIDPVRGWDALSEGDDPTRPSP